ncbi:MAG: helix-turn-helix domain-containing protein [Candidatus Shapirobacteria bacterium]|jgi:cytoskeletal protein RodZ
MYRASIILKNARSDKGLSLDEVSKKLKIPQRYLESIENENILCFPQEPYCSLIIKDYADYLGLNGQQIVGLFRRDFAQKRKTKTTNKSFISFTPQFTFTVIISFLVMLFSFYLVYEYIKFNRPPKLIVDWPAKNMVTKDVVEIRGSTDPESTVRVNQDLVIVDPEGNFTKKINLQSEETKITVESKSPSGKTTQDERTVRVVK